MWLPPPRRQRRGTSQARAVGTVLLLVLFLAGCPRQDAPMPLPWHGPLTVLAWRDIATGKFPLPACRDFDDDPTDRARVVPRLLNQVTTSESFSCSSFSADSVHQFQLLGAGGAVQHYSIVRYEAHGQPTRLDSIFDALSAVHGPGQKCRMEGFFHAVGVVGAVWQARGYTAHLVPGMPDYAYRGVSTRMILVQLTTEDSGSCRAADMVPSGGPALGTVLDSAGVARHRGRSDGG